jgi:hypothetical protein
VLRCELRTVRNAAAFTMPCRLSDVLKHAAQRAEELIDHLRNFNPREHVRFEEIDKDGWFGIFLAVKFNYLVDSARDSHHWQPMKYVPRSKAQPSWNLSLIWIQGCPPWP